MNPYIKFNNILKLYIKEEEIEKLPYRWGEPHRYYHTIYHLINVIDKIENNIYFNELCVLDKHALLLAAFFHDIIYNSKFNNNEDQSIKYFIKSFKSSNQELLRVVCDLINITKYRKRPINWLKRIFWDADNATFLLPYEEQVIIDQKIRKEYSHLSKELYKENRIKFYESNIGLFNSNVDNIIKKLIENVKKIY